MGADQPFSCPAGCGPPAAGKHSTCTPASDPSSSEPGHSLPSLWRNTSPLHIEPIAHPPKREPGNVSDEDHVAILC